MSEPCDCPACGGPVCPTCGGDGVGPNPVPQGSLASPAQPGTDAALLDVDSWTTALGSRNGSDRGMAEYVVARIRAALTPPPAEPTLDDRLRYHPVTGDGDFEQGSLAYRLDTLADYYRHEGMRLVAPPAEPTLDALHRDLLLAYHTFNGRCTTDLPSCLSRICVDNREALAARLATIPEGAPTDE